MLRPGASAYAIAGEFEPISASSEQVAISCSCPGSLFVCRCLSFHGARGLCPVLLIRHEVESSFFRDNLKTPPHCSVCSIVSSNLQFFEQ
jgi:hypothetical protein